MASLSRHRSPRRLREAGSPPPRPPLPASPQTPEECLAAAAARLESSAASLELSLAQRGGVFGGASSPLKVTASAQTQLRRQLLAASQRRQALSAEMAALNDRLSDAARDRAVITDRAAGVSACLPALQVHAATQQQHIASLQKCAAESGSRDRKRFPRSVQTRQTSSSGDTDADQLRSLRHEVRGLRERAAKSRRQRSADSAGLAALTAELERAGEPVRTPPHTLDELSEVRAEAAVVIAELQGLRKGHSKDLAASLLSREELSSARGMLRTAALEAEVAHAAAAERGAELTRLRREAAAGEETARSIIADLRRRQAALVADVEATRRMPSMFTAADAKSQAQAQIVAEGIRRRMEEHERHHASQEQRLQRSADQNTALRAKEENAVADRAAALRSVAALEATMHQRDAELAALQETHADVGMELRAVQRKIGEDGAAVRGLEESAARVRAACDGADLAAEAAAKAQDSAREELEEQRRSAAASAAVCTEIEGRCAERSDLAAALEAAVEAASADVLTADETAALAATLSELNADVRSLRGRREELLTEEAVAKRELAAARRVCAAARVSEEEEAAAKAAAEKGSARAEQQLRDAEDLCVAAMDAAAAQPLRRKGPRNEALAQALDAIGCVLRES